MNQQPVDNTDNDTNDDREDTSSQTEQDELLLPFICPITKLIFVNPVILSDGYTYEWEYALKLLAKQNPISPFTNEPLDKNIILPNRALKDAINIFLKMYPEYQSLQINDFK